MHYKVFFTVKEKIQKRVFHRIRFLLSVPPTEILSDFNPYALEGALCLGLSDSEDVKCLVQ